MIIYLSIAVLPSIMVHPSTRPLGGDSPIWKQRQDYSITEHPSTCLVDGISPTRRRQQNSLLLHYFHPSRYIHPLTLVGGDSPTRRQRQDYSITEHPSTRLIDWIYPTWRRQQDFSVAEIFSLGESLNVLLIGFPYSETSMQTCPRTFSRSSYRSRNPPL